MKLKKTIPFEFLIEELSSMHPTVKPFFGAHGIYRGETILFILRKKEAHPEDNGVWVATYKEHHESLKKHSPALRNIFLLGGDTNWLNLPEESDSFEEDVCKLASLVLKNDLRIGRIPAKKKKKN
jgi:hypothetical protein